MGLGRTGGKLDLQVLEIECPVELEDHVHHHDHFILDLLIGAEDVSIVLAKGPYPGQTRRHATALVAMQATEVGIAYRQIAIGAFARLVDQAMGGTVHRLDGELALVYLGEIHGLPVVLVVARGVPEVDIEDLRVMTSSKPWRPCSWRTYSSSSL